MSKRSAIDEAGSSVQTKRVKRAQTDGHAPGCSDPECEGCDVGEIEISFVKKNSLGQEEPATPSARELLAMALEEAAGGSDGDDDNVNENMELVKRLFDMALEQFKENEPDDKLGYALCLVELGRIVSVEESIREGLDTLRHLNKKESSDDTTLGLARAAFALASFLRTRQNKWFKEEREELDEDEDEKEFELLLQKHKVSREESKLCKEGLEAAGKVLEQNDSTEPNRDQRRLLHEIYGYVQLLDEPIHVDHVNLITDAAVKSIKQLKYQNDYDLLALLAAFLLHRQRILGDDEKGKALCIEAKKYLTEAKKLYLEKHEKEYPWGWELHALASLALSNVLEDEDQVLESFDEALEAFKKALELNPGNKNVAEMIDMLQGSINDDNDEE